MIAWLLIWPILAASVPTLPTTAGPQADLAGWLLAHKRLGPPAGPKRLEEVLQRGEAVYLDGGARSTAATFGAVLSDASFGRLANSPAYDNLRYDLAGVLARQGAEGRARRLLLELIGRRPPSDFRSPAFRKLVDLTLRSGQLEQTLTALDRLGFQPSADERDEIAYLKGKALYGLGHAGQAVEALSAVSPISRLFAAANYLAGLIALQQGRQQEAEDRFCRLVHGSEQGRTTFFLSEDAGRVVAHAWLALARLRHDRRQYARAIETYRRVPAGFGLRREARYEAAWSQYRLGDMRAARTVLGDLLEGAGGLSERPQAELLLGYALMGDCLFDRADALFADLEHEQTALAAALADDSGSDPRLPHAVRAWIPQRRDERRLLALRAGIRGAGRRVAWLRAELDRVASGMPRRDPPRPKLALGLDLARDLSRARGLRQRLADLRARLGTAEGEQAKRTELQRLEAQVRSAEARALAALDRLRAGRLTPPPGPAASGSLPLAYLARERAGLADLQRRLAEQRLRARELAGQAARARAGRAEVRVAGWARQAALGRVDAVMGRKQALEIEVQNLALGRYPLSLLRELAEAGQLDESVEYWPFDGEHWPDEYE